MRLHDEEEIELTCLKSFKEQTPQRLLCSIPMISLRRMMGGVPRALNAEAGLAVAFCRMRARSASLNVPSCWRLSLKIFINSAQGCCKKYLFPHPPKVQCSQSGSKACALAAATRKSCGVTSSGFFPPKNCEKAWAIHFSSSILVVACHL